MYRYLRIIGWIAYVPIAFAFLVNLLFALANPGSGEWFVLVCSAVYTVGYPVLAILYRKRFRTRSDKDKT